MIVLVMHSSCAHYVMRDVTSGIIGTLVMLLMCCFCLIMVAQFSLLHLWHFGVSKCISIFYSSHINLILQLFYFWSFGRDDSLCFSMTGMY